MMFLIIVTICHPIACVTERRVADVSPMACAGLGHDLQAVAADVMKRYPGWTVRRLGCERPEDRRE